MEKEIKKFNKDPEIRTDGSRMSVLEQLGALDIGTNEQVDETLQRIADEEVESHVNKTAVVLCVSSVLGKS